jgi:hypothetical protein
MEVIGQLHASAGLPPEKEPPVPIEQEACSAPQPVWTFRIRETSLPRPGIEPRTVQPVAYSVDHSGIRTYHDVCITSQSDFQQCLLQITVGCLCFFIMCTVNILQILTAPTKAQFYYYVFYV